MHRLFALVVVVAAVVSLAAACSSTAPADDPWAPDRGAPAAAAPGAAIDAADAPRRHFETVRLYVDGMTCPVKCAREVKEMLSGVPGVVGVVVDTNLKEAICTVHTGTDPRALVAAVRSPYRARLL